VEIKTHSIQNNFLSGVLDQRAQGRVDTNAYISSMLEGTNVEMIHLGGVQRRRGLVQKLVCPNQIQILTGTYALPNGPVSTVGLGTNSQTNTFTTTTPPNTTNPWVLVSVDLGSVQNVLFADCLNITLASGSSTQFQIQYSNDNTNWTTLGTAFPQLDSTAPYTYRRTAGVTYPATYTAARYWRVAKIGGTALASEVSFSDFVIWGDTGRLSAGRLLPFEVSTGEQYVAVLSDHSAIITSNGAVVDYVALPYATGDLAALDAASTAESMMIVHANYAPQFLIRLSSPLATGVANASYYNFQTYLPTFANIPKVDFADSASPTPTSEIQTLTFTSDWNPGDTFTLTILTDTTGPITYAGDNQTTANAIAKAVQALWVVNGFTGVSCTSNGTYTYTLTFANDAAGPMGVISITSLSSSATATAVSTQTGVSRQEPAWSATRGYPSVVTFFQGRMYFAGLKSLPESVIGSWVDDILNFATDQGLDDQAIFVTLNGVALNAITALFPGRSLCLFTTGGEFRFPNENQQPITPASAPINQTQYGTAKIKPVMIDGNIVFVQRNKNSIRDFQFDYTQDQFNSLGLSSFAGNLVYNVQDMASWNGSTLEEINLVFVCNGVNGRVNDPVNPNPLPDGTCGVFNTRKEANVSGWTLWQTSGKFMNVCAIVENVFFLVQRTLGSGASALILEQATEGTFTDCGTGVVTPGGTVNTVSGLSWLNGLTCRVRVDGGIILDDVVPVNGTVSLTLDGRAYNATTYEIGLNYNPKVTPMPVQTVRWPSGSNLAQKRRIRKIRAKVLNTLGLLYNSNGESAEILPTATIDTINFDSAPAPFSGTLSVEDSSNWDEADNKTVTFTQVDPLPFHLMYLDTELASDQ
jgi:hypothetical protein